MSGDEEPGRVTSGDGISACLVCQPPPLGEALGSDPDGPPIARIRLRTMDQRGDACCRREKMVLSQTGEVRRRLKVGNPCL